jgi:hypothetical protein
MKRSTCLIGAFSAFALFSIPCFSEANVAVLHGLSYQVGFSDDSDTEPDSGFSEFEDETSGSGPLDSGDLERLVQGDSILVGRGRASAEYTVLKGFGEAFVHSRDGGEFGGSV